MKRCLKFIGIFIIAIVFANSVSASSVTWDQIKEEWKNEIDNNGFHLKILNTSDELLVFQVTTDDTYNNIYLTYKFENDVITMNVVNKDNMDELQKYKYVSSEDVVSIYMIEFICKLYNVDPLKLDYITNNNYGIVLDGDPYTYEKENNGSSETYSGTLIKNFSIDLNKFEESTKDLVGTYDENRDSIDSDSKADILKDDDLTKSNISLSLVNAYSNKLDLIVSVSNVSENNKNRCDIWLIDSDGVESLVATIDNCVEGENSVDILNLVPDTEYLLKAEFIKIGSLNSSSSVFSDTFKFKTLSSNSNEISVENPKTGGSYIYLVFGCLFISIFTILILSTCNKKNEQFM